MIYICMLLSAYPLHFKTVLIRPETVEMRQYVRQAQNDNYCFKYNPTHYDYV